MSCKNKRYLFMPEQRSCYEYMTECYKKISDDFGDYAAFVNCDCETSMSKMIADIEKLAAFISSKGFKQDDVISVFLPTSAHAFLAFYALNKLGIISDFIHPLTPPALLKEKIALTKSKGIFMLDKFALANKETLKNMFTIICRTSDYTYGKIKDAVIAQEKNNGEALEGENIYNYSYIMSKDYGSVPTVKGRGEKTAVYMHSSGTTGKSKTVELSSRAINHMAYKNSFLDYDHNYGNSYNLCVLPCFHAFGLGTAMHYCMCNAFSSIVMPKFDAVKANDYIARYPVQHIVGAPSMFRKMYNAENFVNPGLKNLKLLFSGGDIVSESFINNFTKTIRENGSAAFFCRGWGLTEMCAVCATNTRDNYRENSIGKPVVGVKSKIFDEDKNPLPAGVNGEIALSGETMMNGYLPDGSVEGSGIWTDEDGEKWVFTGDMGYLDEDGFLYFTGRKKRIIIISGYNIYPYTMEQKLAFLPYIKEVCAVQGYDGEKSLVKLCVALNKTSLTHEEIKKDIVEFCKREFNSFAVPRKIVIMDSLPRTNMDKIDFLKLCDPVPAI